MKIIYITILLMMAIQPAEGDDFRPHVRIQNTVSKSTRLFSGTICDSTESQYLVVTCAHGFADLPKDKRKLVVELFSEDGGLVENAEILKEDIDKDIAILAIKKRDYAVVRPIPIASDAKLSEGTECLSYGYTPEYTKRVMSITSYSKYSGTNGDQLLLCSGHIESGMSGGALVHQGHIFGVLSTSTKHPGGLYATASHIIEVRGRK